MKKLVSISTLAVAGVVTTGLIAFQTPVVAAEGGDAAFQRKDDTPDVLVAIDDEDDDDTFARDDTRTNAPTNTNDDDGDDDDNDGDTNTGNSRSTNDNTNSRFSAVSRDRDLSRSDLTRDWTQDGPGKKKRDWSANSTNDRSRNDTRR